MRKASRHLDDLGEHLGMGAELDIAG